MRDDDPDVSLDTAADRWRWAESRADALLNYAYTQTKVREVARDAVRHAVALANESPARTPGALYCWLRRIVHHAIVDDVRAHGTVRALSLLAGVAVTVVDDPQEKVADESEDRWAVAEIEDELTPREFHAMRAHGTGRSTADLATDLGMTKHSVETMLWRARSRCQKRLARARAGLGGLLPMPRRRWRPGRLAVVVPAGVGALALAVTVVRLPDSSTQRAALESPRGGFRLDLSAGASPTPRPTPTPTPHPVTPPGLPTDLTGKPTSPYVPRPKKPLANRKHPASLLPTVLPTPSLSRGNGATERDPVEHVTHCVQNAVRGAAASPTATPNPCAYPSP
jgi:DNA-directed RNA polymerase specialized sigma24 family protein